MSFAIVTPIWETKLTDIELAMLKITSATNYDIDRYFLTTHELDISFYEKHFKAWKYIRISNHHLASVDSYNKYMLTPDLYERMHNYEFSVICQLDAVLVRNIIHLKLNNIDYVGSPWKIPRRVNWPRLLGIRVIDRILDVMGFSKKISVGNGGLSIRRNYIFQVITQKLYYRRFIKINEDTFFSYLGKTGKMRCATVELAGEIFMETTAESETSLPEVYGFHALEKWNPKLAEKLVKEFKW